jgi:hypothetical protein
MKLFFSALVSLGIGLASLPNQAHAVGCVSGAVVGGVAGHVAGHHGFLGAAAGCAIGHHAATVKKRQAAATQTPAASPGLAAPTPSGQ